MTPQERKVFELALRALTHGGCPPDCKDGMTDSGGVHPWGEAALIPCPNCQTITAIKEALAQPEQELVGWSVTYSKVIKALAAIVTVHTPDNLFDLDAIPRDPVMGLVQQIRVAIDGYRPPQRKPLSDEEMKKIWYAMQNIMGWYSFQEIARAIEAAHNIKE